MKKYLLAAAFVLFVVFTQAQMVVPVKWDVKIKPLKGGNQYEIVATAKIDAGFKLYGVDLDEGGPIKTSFNFETLENCKQFGKAVEVTPSKKAHDKTFDMEVSYFKETATISHKIWVTEKPAKVSGYIQWMSCNDDMCTPPTDEEFEFVIE
ncbi:protein-disulfide reductase DsbD family protein [Draconibacterium sp. IB214405]|uniref:protein-disulfide reductase DsbD domain-containing protein n=1 Tax=Draconibacterium sp. IB214405 TaxID=3097352 RepID=UPI002A0B3D74|nr:protein-disulfide reductase DsbD domain-containing protein [Draconibacterium sp. IB214405]MDX8340282.1 protein-disulfide reductase DsbD family protein [Draconibacterium sp. IB214405]